jgi:hypothetical protein
VSPDNESRQAINAAIRREFRRGEDIGPDKYVGKILINRQDLTVEDQKLAGESGDGACAARSEDRPNRCAADCGVSADDGARTGETVLGISGNSPGQNSAFCVPCMRSRRRCAALTA